MEAATAITSTAIILGAPILPSFGFVENTLVRFLLIAGIVFASRQGAMPGILAFLAAISLLIERNHEVLTKFPEQKPRFPTANFGFPIQATPLTPVIENVPYAPPTSPVIGKEEDMDSAKGLGDNIPRLPPAPPAAGAMSFYKSKGLL